MVLFELRYVEDTFFSFSSPADSVKLSTNIPIGDINNITCTFIGFRADHMTHMIRKSKSKTIRVLADVYVTIEGPATGLLDTFYGRLLRYVHEDPETAPASDGLDRAASKLFSDLFAVVYRTVAAASDKPNGGGGGGGVPQFDDDYVQCLVGKASEIRPFGDVPYTLAKDISRTFAATGVLVHALK